MTDALVPAIPSAPAAPGVPLVTLNDSAPELWTTVNGDSLFSFSIKVNMRAMLEQAGVTNFLDKEFAFLSPGAKQNAPGVNVTQTLSRIDDRCKLFINDVLGRLCGGEINGSSFGLSALYSQPYNTFHINVPAPYALAMAKLFNTENRREGFVEPTDSKPLPEGAPTTPAELMSLLSAQAQLAVDTRNELLVQTPKEWGELGAALGAVAGNTFTAAQRKRREINVTPGTTP